MVVIETFSHSGSGLLLAHRTHLGALHCSLSLGFGLLRVAGVLLGLPSEVNKLEENMSMITIKYVSEVKREIESGK